MYLIQGSMASWRCLSAEVRDLLQEHVARFKLLLPGAQLLKLSCCGSKLRLYTV
jgi:hypothetical protein